MTGRISTHIVLALCVAALAALFSLQGANAAVVFVGIAAATFIGLVIINAVASPAETAVEAPADRRMPTGFGRSLIEKLPTALVVISAQGRIDYANPAAEHILPQLRIGDHFANLVRAPRFVEAVNAAIARNADSTASFELPGSGRVFDAQVTYLPHGVDQGIGAQVVIQFEDRTEARRADEMRKDFIANASHELRTPLASIIGYIDTLRGHAKDDPEASERFLGIMSSQAARMNRLVDDLMSLTRIEMNAHIPPRETLDLGALVREAAAALEPVAKMSGTTMHVNLPEGQGPFVTGAWDELTQVATNLIDNAIKYGGKDGTVTVGPAKPNEKYPRTAGIYVTDQGTGINRENLHRLTERFYRVDSAESRNRGGTGLGLAIVKHVMAHHNGALQIESVPGEGSTFTFWTPLSQNSAAAIDSPKERVNA